MDKCIRCGVETSLYINEQPVCLKCDSNKGNREARRSTALPRHQCLIYDGSPSKHLNGLATLIADNLKSNIRCLYLNSPPMVAGLRSYLAAKGMDVAGEIARGSLMLSSDQDHLVHSLFDPTRMLDALSRAVLNALGDGYQGLWATGDMTWELGQDKDFGKLLEYERRLEELFKKFPQLSGICQYHRETLPTQTVHDALSVHPAIYFSETLTRMNPYYDPRTPTRQQPSLSVSHLESMLNSLERPLE